MAIYAYVSGEDQMKNRHKSESGGSAFFTFFSELSERCVIYENTNLISSSLNHKGVSNEIWARLEFGDTLLLSGLHSLSSSADEIASALIFFAERGITVQCLSGIDCEEGFKKSVISYSFIPKIHSSIGGVRLSIRKDKKAGRPYGSKHSDEIRNCRRAGYTQSLTALLLNVSISTVKRHWK